MIQNFSKKESIPISNEYIKDQKNQNFVELNKKLIPVNYLVRKSEKAQEEKDYLSRTDLEFLRTKAFSKFSRFFRF